MIKRLLPLLFALAAITVFSGCEDDDHYVTTRLVGYDWQGYLGTYYYDRWHVSGEEYNTVMRFTSRDSYYTSGRGYELDININNRRQDYAFATFKWFIVDGELTLIYDDNLWAPVYITDYHISETSFRGRIYDGSNRNIQFDFTREDFVDADWWYDNSYYRSGRTSGYFNDGYYYAPRQEGVKIIDRSALLDQTDGPAYSIRSGVFATE